MDLKGPVILHVLSLLQSQKGQAPESQTPQSERAWLPNGLILDNLSRATVDRPREKPHRQTSAAVPGKPAIVGEVGLLA
jgi:hypothetical protein